MGANAWKTAAAWPPPTEPLTLTLTAAAPGRLGTLTASLSGTGHEASVVPSDPDNPVRNPFDSAGAHDYRALVDHPHVLTFDSAPLTSDTEVTGTVLADLYVSCDCRDTDIWARLYDVAPDGTAFNLMSPGLDVLRASYREPRKGRQLLTPGEIYELRLDTLVTSNLFRRGHRIRLQVSTAFFPNFSRNLHSGDLETTSSRRQKATVTLHHGPDHPSRVVLPVARQ
jgi:putative CocE/NonD family hydrolase